jgi:hypothetical protein
MTMVLKLSIVVMILVLLFDVAEATVLPANSPNVNRCSVIDATRPPQFIVYESKFESQIRLRLRNNSSCAIVVETDDEYPIQLKKQPDGGIKVESVLDSREGLRVGLHYLIQNRRRGEALKRGYGWGDSVFTYEIPAGQSILFDVPDTQLKRRYDIAAPFAYSWEGSKSIATGVGSVVHQVYFLFEDLPAVALR